MQCRFAEIMSVCEFLSEVSWPLIPKKTYFAPKFEHVSFAAARLPFFEHFDFDLGVQKLVVSREVFVLIPEQLV